MTRMTLKDNRTRIETVSTSPVRKCTRKVKRNNTVPKTLDLRGFGVPTDVVIIVEGHRLYLNKGILSSVSPVFDKMFHADFKEKSQDEISLPGKKCEDFISFLSCIYPSMMERVNKDNLERILPLADEYQVEQLMKRCDEFCVTWLTGTYFGGGFFNSLNRFSKSKHYSNHSHVVHMLVLSEKYNLKGTWQTAFALATKMIFSKLQMEKEFGEISSQTIMQLMRRRIVTLETAELELLEQVPYYKGATDFREVLGE
ncbi:uncharacterized protein LOC121380868 [Gigantopelta aegis]|uniref:uncharacterized protein LOC121380868 n=1 Tax=Gigantopelta aegis TaxID=1735272 RepID=UPI001B8893E9|nr:uncharacterized protein LOC121380868 [Gigantopelta aegis]